MSCIPIVERSVRIWQMCSAGFQEYAVIIIPIRSFFAVLLRSPIRWSLQQRSVESSLHLWIRTAPPAAERGYYLIQPPKIMGKDDNYYGQVRITTVAAELLPELMDEGKNFIAFTKSRKNVEIVLKETRDHLEAEIGRAHV